MCHLASWLVESSEAMIWRQHCPKLVEFVNPGMLLDEERYTVHQLLEHTNIDGMKNIGDNYTRLGEVFHIPEVVI